MHLRRNSPDTRGMITMQYHFTVELRLRKYYQAMPLEAISSEDWQVLALTVITTFRLIKWRNRSTS